MELHRIMRVDHDRTQHIFLKEVGGERGFGIAIGTTEANAIDRRVGGGVEVRPQTHDLLAAVIEALGGELDRIEINDLRNGTYYASLHIRAGGKIVEVDCRPSDAIAVAAGTPTPIFVAEHVLEAIG